MFVYIDIFSYIMLNQYMQSICSFLHVWRVEAALVTVRILHVILL